MRLMEKKNTTSLKVLLIVGLVSLGCGFVEPIKEKIAGTGGQAQAVEVAVATPRPTFTPTPDWTATPTVTLTPMPTATPTNTPFPTDTPIPTDTPTPVPTDTPLPTETPPPTNTPKPVPPTATFTPAPPPTPSYPFKIAEGPLWVPTTNSWLVIYFALVDANNVPIGGLKVVGDHTNGIHKVSAESCYQYCESNGYSGTVKQGNVKFEAPLESGTWNLYVVDGGGAQVSDVIPMTIDVNNPGWAFMILRR